MDWLGVVVVGAVCVWLAILVLVVLRSAFFMLTLVWLAALHIIEARSRNDAAPPA